ncbi:aldehyde dehydrogenase [Chryseobacterium wanjuense]
MNKQIKTSYSSLFIGGEWIKSTENNFSEVKNPHDQSTIGSVPLASTEDMDLAVKVAKESFDSKIWRSKSLNERLSTLKKFQELHNEYALSLAEMITLENGSSINFNRLLQEQFIPATNKGIFEEAEKFDWEISRENADGSNVLVVREPVGIVAAIIPWNAPQQSALGKIIPALLAGNSVILKPTPETAIDAMALGDIFNEAGLPKGVLSILPADREVSAYLVSIPEVDKIAFTGSTRAGISIAQTAGAQMKRFTLELGGKSAGIILDDATDEQIINTIIARSLANNGQSCIGLTRLLVPKNRYEEITDTIANAMNQIKIGDPMDAGNYLESVFHEPQYNRVKDYIQIGIDEGAVVKAGGLEKPEGEAFEKGWYIKPTLFTHVTNQMRIAREEIFGSVLVAIPYDTVEEAIAIANDSEYGLGGGIITSDRRKGLEIAKQIRTGGISLNTLYPDFGSPFGGFKKSGVGREMGKYALESFTELKTIVY